MRERTKSFWKAFLGAAVAFTLVFSVAAPASADTTAGEGGGGGGASGTSSWYWAYGDRPGDAWNAFVADWGNGVREGNGTIYASDGTNLGANLNTCKNAAQIWWIHFNNPNSARFWGLDPGYNIRDSGGTGHLPNWWVDNTGLTGAARDARGYVPAGTTLSDGYTTPSGGYFTDWVKSRASSYVSSSTSNSSSVVVVCSTLSPALVVDESGTQTRTITNGDTYNSPSSFATTVQREVLNTTNASTTDGGADLIGVNNLHDQAAVSVTTNYGNVLRGIVNGTLFGSTPMNNLSRAQWTQIATLIANARTQDTTLQHGQVELDAANKAGLAEGGVLNVTEWAQRATITTSGSQTYQDPWRYTGVRYWSGSGWGPVQNVNWIDTKLSTTPVWNNGNGWTLASESYSVTSANPTQENTGFWQLLSVHCNLDELNALKSALVAAGRSATVIQQTNNDDGTITAILRTPVRNQGWADVPVSNAAQQQAVNNAQAALTAAQAAHASAVTAYNTAVTNAAAAQTAYNNAQTAYNNRNSAYGLPFAALNTANTNLTNAQTNYGTARDEALAASVALRQYVNNLTTGSGSTNGYTETSGSISGASSSNAVVDSSGNLYYRTASAIMKVTPAGVSSTFVTATTIGFGLAIDGQNRVYFVTSGGILQRATSTGVVSTLATVGTIVGGLDVDSNYNVYLSNYTSGTVQRVTAAGAVSTFVTGISYAWGVAVDDSNNVYVASYDTNQLFRFPSTGGTPVAVATLASPLGVAFANGNVYVSQWTTGNVFVLNGTTLSPVMTSTTAPVTGGTSSYGIAVGSDGTIYNHTSGGVYKKYTAANGIAAADKTAMISALTSYESTYATGYVANPSTTSNTAVNQATALRASTVDGNLRGFIDTFTTKNSALATAWTAYSNAQSAQVTAQNNYNTAAAAVESYRVALLNAGNALEAANDAVEDAADLVTTRANAITTAQNNLAAAQAALVAANGVTQRVWSPARPSILDFGDANNPSAALAASGYVGFYDKECVTDCTSSPTGTGSTAANGGTGNASNTTNLGHKDSFGGAVLTDATAREQGNTSPSTNSNYLEIFRDNSQSRTVRVNTSYPVVSGTNFSYNGGAPFTTTVNIWGMSTPDTNPAAGQFFMTATNITNRAGAGTSEVLFDGLNGTSIWTSDLNRAPGTQKNFGNDLYSTGISETFSGFANTFQVGGTWASETDRPVVLNIKWEYRPTTTVTVPANIGFGTVATGSDNASQISIARTENISQALDVRCYAQYGITNSLDNNLDDLTQQYTGTGSVNNIDTGLITSANGDDSYLENNNLVLKFIRGVAE